MARNLYEITRDGFYSLLAVDHRKMHSFTGFFFKRFKILVYSLVKFNQDRGFQRSSTLAYSMLLALLPMALILLVMMNALGMLEKMKPYVETLIKKNFLPESVSEEVVTQVMNNAASTMDKLQTTLSQNTALYSFISFLVFIVTVVFFFSSIERNLNDLWGAKRNRSVINRFKNFWCVMTIGPIFLFASFYLSYAMEGQSVFSNVIVFVLPNLLIVLALYLIYLLMPYTAIRMDSAFWGALVAGLVWMVLKDQFNAFAEGSFKREAYNYLWLIPVTLAWLYLTWVVILIGMEIVFCTQNFEFLDSGYIGRGKNEGFSREYLAVGLMVSISENFVKGQPPPKFSKVASRIGVPEHNLFEAAKELQKAGLIESAREGSLYYRPSKPPKDISVGDVTSAVRGESFSVPPNAHGALAETLRNTFHKTREITEKELGGTSLESLLFIGGEIVEPAETEEEIE